MGVEQAEPAISGTDALLAIEEEEDVAANSGNSLGSLGSLELEEGETEEPFSTESGRGFEAARSARTELTGGGVAGFETRLDRFTDSFVNVKDDKFVRLARFDGSTGR